ncbi:AraC family transcriptional regulator [Parapedobacter indicus]|uniref:Transcriptional regulator, AraC family n=1 Tax=Parapedobacter indicus TaxID=1477437 RepID=A0A1I3GTM1_9SPHI|nr:AraC family transcriptional regulator [Parapedobacter indicus]PPL02775.1 AraC family transcriptional regulator [Parapedobacter indicus]SFI26691.1 transcriptional regulator, AraC family [Parapedobacter indicus]
MKIIEQRLPQDYDKSFIVFQERGQFFPYQWHYHPEYELVLVTQSTGRRMVGDHIGYFDKGDLVFMGPCLPHVWVNDARYMNGRAGQIANAIVIQFKPDFLGDKFLLIPEMERVRYLLGLSSRGLHIHGNARDKIALLMGQMLEMNGIQRLATLFSIFDTLVRTSDYEMLSSPGYIQHTRLDYSNRIDRVTEHIMRNFDREITLKEIASVAGMAVATFCIFFKEHYRMTFVEYINTIRIGYACKLLAESSLNIMEVAYRSGFNNLGNFNKRFRSVKRMTPTEYRKQIEVTPKTAAAL